MLRLLCGAALVLTALFATATMALSREWETGEVDEGWQVVFTSWVDELGMVSQIMNLDGSNVQQLALDGHQRIYYSDCSPDGNALGIVSEGKVYAIEAGGILHPLPTNLISAGELSVSNHNITIIVNHFSTRTYMVNPLTSQWLELTDKLSPHQYGNGYGFDLAPDGSRTAYLTEFLSIRVINLVGELVASLPARAYVPKWSPDGLLAFEAEWDGNSEIYIMDVDRSLVVQFTHDTYGLQNAHPFWSPDGQYILYFHNALQGGYTNSLTIMRLDGSEQRLLTLPVSLGPFAHTPCVIAFRPNSLISLP